MKRAQHSSLGRGIGRLVLGIALALPAAAWSPAARFTTFDYPGSAASAPPWFHKDS